MCLDGGDCRHTSKLEASTGRFSCPKNGRDFGTVFGTPRCRRCKFPLQFIIIWLHIACCVAGLIFGSESGLCFAPALHHDPNAPTSRTHTAGGAGQAHFSTDARPSITGPPASVRGIGEQQILAPYQHRRAYVRLLLGIGKGAVFVTREWLHWQRASCPCVEVVSLHTTSCATVSAISAGDSS